MHFIVSADGRTIAPIHQQGVEHFARLAALQGHGAAKKHNIAFARNFAHGRLKRPRAQRLGKSELVGVACAHQRPIFGQEHPICAALGGLAHQAAHGVDIGFGVRARHHLHGGGGEGVHGFAPFDFNFSDGLTRLYAFLKIAARRLC